MAMMTELFYGDKNPAWSYSTYHDYNDHNNRHHLDPQFAQDNIMRYMQPPIEIRCCSRCEDRLRAALRNVPGVDSVSSTHHNKKLIVTGSADRHAIHYALKHIQKRHHHFLPAKLQNPFRLLFPRHSHSRYSHSHNAPHWNHASTHYTDDHRSRDPYGSGGHTYYENDEMWRDGGRFGHGYGQAPECRYRPGGFRNMLFDSRRSSHHSHSGYSYH